MEIGKPYSGNRKKDFKIEDGDNVYRILPPMGSLAKRGLWSVYYEVQWGFRGTNGKNRPFQDCRVVNRKTKMVEVESSAYLYRQFLIKQKDKIKELVSQGKASKEQLKDALEMMKKYNLEARHYLNVVNLKGEIGRLKINNKFKKALDAEISKYKNKYNEHPLVLGDGMTGVYFNFNRYNDTGRIQDYVFSVSLYRDAGDSETGKTHTMDKAFINRLDSEASDLSTLFPCPTAEEVKRMVSNKDNPAAIDEVMDKYYKNSSNSNNLSTDSKALESTTDTVEEAKVEESKVEESSVSSSELDESEFLSSLEAGAEKQAEPKKSSKEEKEVDLTDLSDEDFLKQLEQM